MGTAVLFDTANLICETWRCCRTGKCCWFCVSCRSGGIGRRAWFRSTYSQGCGGSSPFFGTKKSIFRPYWNCLLSRMLGLLADRRQCAFTQTGPISLLAQFRESSLIENCLDLLKMVPIVRSHVSSKIDNPNLSPFRVNTKSIPLVRGEPSAHAQVCLPQQTKHLQRFRHTPRRIVAESCPFVLIERGERTAAILDHLPVSPTRYQFVFGKMSDDLHDRPLIRVRTAAERLFGHSPDELRQYCQSLSLHREWIAPGRICVQPRPVAVEI